MGVGTAGAVVEGCLHEGSVHRHFQRRAFEPRPQAAPGEQEIHEPLFRLELEDPGEGAVYRLFDGSRLAAVHLQVERAASQHRLPRYLRVWNVHRNENLFLFLAALNHDRSVFRGHEFAAVDAHEFEGLP